MDFMLRNVNTFVFPYPGMMDRDVENFFFFVKVSFGERIVGET